MTDQPTIPTVSCPHCHGTGWRDHPAQDGVMPCDACERGRRVRALREARRAKREQRRRGRAA